MGIFIFFTTLLCIVAAWMTLMRILGSKREMKGLNIPPGSLGWPIIGETIQSGKIYPSVTIGEFLETRIKRYGKIFKTQVMGSTIIMSADLEFNQFVYQNDGKLFFRYTPPVFMKLLGESAGETSTGLIYHSLKPLIHQLLCIPKLQAHFLDEFQIFTLETLKSWKEGVVFPFHEESKKVTFNMILKRSVSLNPGSKDAEELRRLYEILKAGFRCPPIDLPGTNFRKAIKARGQIWTILERLKDERMEKKNKGCDEIGDSDFLGLLLESQVLTMVQAIENLLGMIMVGHESLAMALLLATYFLGRCPKAVQQLQEEHMKIAMAKKERGESKLTWEDYKVMEFTKCVISETMRLGNIASTVPRKTMKDVNFKGFDIPKGWIVMPAFSTTHMDGKVYEDPHIFNPWRWKNARVEKDMVQNFMPWGLGLHKCPGMDLTKMEISIFLHHMVLNFEWEHVGEDHPFRQYAATHFEKGLPIKVRALNHVV